MPRTTAHSTSALTLQVRQSMTTRLVLDDREQRVPVRGSHPSTVNAERETIRSVENVRDLDRTPLPVLGDGLHKERWRANPDVKVFSLFLVAADYP